MESDSVAEEAMLPARGVGWTFGRSIDKGRAATGVPKVSWVLVAKLLHFVLVNPASFLAIFRSS